MTRVRSILLALAILSIAAPSFAAKPKHRSLQTAQAKKTLAVLDQAERDEAQRREEIARRQAEAEHHETMNRITMLVTLGVALGLVVAWELNRTKRSSAGRAPRRATPGSDRAPDPRDG